MTLPTQPSAEPATSPDASWVAGELIPGTLYRLVRKIGHGGFGEVFEAEHSIPACAAPSRC